MIFTALVEYTAAKISESELAQSRAKTESRGRGGAGGGEGGGDGAMFALLTSSSLLTFNAAVRPASRVPARAACRMGEWVELGSTSADVNAPAAKTFEIISNYARWPEWSPWLSSVTVDGTASRWDLNIKGISVHWLSQTTDTEPGRLVRWESTAGVRNRGVVEVVPSSGSSCTLNIQLRYEIPQLVARLFSTSFVSKFVSGRLAADLQRFSVIAEREAGGGG